MISNSTGRKILDYLNRSINENISITITAHESGQFRELSATSLAFIIVGSVAIVLIVSLMWALFYKIQKHRRIDDRELLSVIILAFY
jgi:Cu/Ag efflux pump CusA